MRRIGLFCGTFNPIHHGHLLIAENAREQFSLEKVFFITSPHPPHRNRGLLAAIDRAEMVAAAVANNKHFQASNIELDREGPSYTVDTLMQMRDEYPDVEFDLILGGDNIEFLKDWHNVDELLAHSRLLIAPRIVQEETQATVAVAQSAVPLPVLKTVGKAADKVHCDLKGATIEIIDFPQVAISSSAVRDRLKHGRSVLYMVPRAVNDILVAKRHYTE